MCQVLNTSRSMRRVHSSRSIRGILERKAKQAGAALATVGEVSIPPCARVHQREGGRERERQTEAETQRRREKHTHKHKHSRTHKQEEDVAIPTIAPPVNQVYDKEDQGVAGGGGKKKGVDPSNLPYLHRNPAI